MDVEPSGPLRNEAAEATFLGCMLQQPALCAEYAQHVDKMHFYRPSHQVVWGAIEYALRHGLTIDLMAVIDYMNARRDPSGQTYLEVAGGHRRVHELVLGVVSPDNQARESFTQLREYHQRRALQRLALNMRADVEEGQPAERIIADISTALGEMATARKDEDDEASAPAMAQTIVDQLTRRLSGEEPGVLDTGIHPVNVLLDGGLAPGVNTVLGALSGHGKTTMASAMIAGLLQQNPDLVVDWYSCEVPSAWQAQRIMSSAFNIHERHWRDPLATPKYAEAAGKATKWLRGLDDRLRIYRMGEIDIRKVSLKTSARRVRHDGPYVVVVDYIQRATYGKADHPIEKIAAASQALAGIALDHNVATLALSQFTTPAQDEPIPMPSPLHARWSKEVLNDAADFLIYHRPFKTNPELERRCILQLAKSRYGRLGHVEMVGTPANRFRWWEDGKGAVPGLNTRELVAQ